MLGTIDSRSDARNGPVLVLILCVMSQFPEGIGMRRTCGESICVLGSQLIRQCTVSPEPRCLCQLVAAVIMGRISDDCQLPAGLT